MSEDKFEELATSNHLVETILSSTHLKYSISHWANSIVERTEYI